MNCETCKKEFEHNDTIFTIDGNQEVCYDWAQAAAKKAIEVCGQRVSFSEERGESEGGQIPGASAEKRMQRTSVDLMGETREPDKSQDSFQNRTYIRGHDTASRKSHSEVHRDKQGGSEAGITQHRIQHGQILHFDAAECIKQRFL